MLFLQGAYCKVKIVQRRQFCFMQIEKIKPHLLLPTLTMKGTVVVLTWKTKSELPSCQCIQFCASFKAKFLCFCNAKADPMGSKTAIFQLRYKNNAKWSSQSIFWQKQSQIEWSNLQTKNVFELCSQTNAKNFLASALKKMQYYCSSCKHWQSSCCTLSVEIFCFDQAWTKVQSHLCVLVDFVCNAKSEFCQSFLCTMFCSASLQKTKLN